MNYRSLFGLLVAPLALTSISWGQTAPNQLTVTSQTQTAPGVADDSRRFFPQIKDAPRLSPDRPENPPPPFNNVIGPLISPMELGGTTAGSRIRTKAAFPGIGPTGWEPPDPNIAVGPTHIVEVVNSDIAWFNKTTGVKEFQTGMDGAAGWFGSVGATDFVFDPKCFYDRVSQRFFVVALELIQPTDSKLLIAVSDDNNPAGTWFKYRIEAKLTVGANTYWLDYPGFASTNDGLAVCGNMFGLSAGGFAGVQFICMKKAPMLTGAATTVTSLRDASADSAQLARTSDTTITTMYGVAFSSASQMRMYAISNFTTTPTVVFQDTAIPAFVSPTRPARSTAGRFLSSIGPRVFNAVYRAGRVYATHNTMVSNSDDRLTAKWYQVKTNGWPTTGAPSLEMAGQVNGAGVDHWMPAIGVNDAGDVALVFSRASTSIIADVMVASRKSNDPAGTMGTPVKLSGSLADYGSPGGINNPNRWGDYFDTAVDPSNGLTFWGVGMIGNATGNWQTIIQSFTVSTPISTAGQYDALQATMYDGTSFTGTFSDVHQVDGFLFKVVSRFVRFLGSVAAIETRFDVDPIPGPPSVIGIKVKTTSTLKNTGMWWLWNWTTNQYDHIGSWTQNTTMGTPLTLSTTKNLTKYLNANGEVRVVVRTTTKPNVNVSYTLSADQIQLLVNFGGTGGS